jgi:hypothetical protein
MIDIAISSLKSRFEELQPFQRHFWIFDRLHNLETIGYY